MIIPPLDRPVRRYNATPEDQRPPFARDRDRILYSSAFRRLAGVTQIARAGEADVFHTRLVHTIKVAQVGRRLAEYVIENHAEESSALGVSAEVVEAACLAHDLGHPPFGHLGEHTLNELASKHDPDGFEGNAQSFRILTKLAVRFESHAGLDLTRATLAACLKYPWLRDPNSQRKAVKWSAYQTEREDFAFARLNSDAETRTVEAELMDWADDIAYSVHDLEDFHRCQFLPWREIFGDVGRKKLVEAALGVSTSLREKRRLEVAHQRLAEFVLGTVGELLNDPYEGTREQRHAIRLMTSQFIGHFIQSTTLRLPTGIEPAVFVPEEVRSQVDILKQITRTYILSSPALAAQQRGQHRVLTELYEDLYEQDAKNYLPRKFSYLFQGQVGDASKARYICDCISSLTEHETVALHGRLRGTASGSLLDPIVR